MKLMKAVKTAVISAAMLPGTTAFGAGFQLTEQGVTGLGRSYAGAGIVGDDLSAVAHNPAGMTLLSGTRVQQNAVVVSLDFEYSGSQTENGRDTPTVVPSGIITHQLNENVWLGLGITVPYGLKVRYNDDWEGRAKGISAGITTIDFNPSIAWKVNEHLSIGAGVSAVYARAKLKNGLPLGPNAEFEYKGDDWVFGYDLGIMVTPVESLRFGISYRSALKVNADGDYTLRGLSVNHPLGTLNGGDTVDGSARLETPETVMISGTWEATDKLRLSGLIRWSNWKNFDTLDFAANEGDFNLPTQMIIQGVKSSGTNLAAVSVENNWKAAWLFTLGADYEVNDQWTVRGGIGLETDPIKHQQNRTALIPDTKRLWLSCGFSYMPNKNWQFDVAYAHLRGIGNDKLYNHKAVGGQYLGKFNQTNAWLVGAAIQYHF
ncbi:MAG: outer membrane protein transport protein [Burkholderiaceae bacterium]|nr:outer membrane protein transport protein [Burkholderiaceae bacterium]